MSKTRKFRCLLCGHIHDEAKDGFFDQLEKCPMCGSDPKYFVEVEEDTSESGQAADDNELKQEESQSSDSDNQTSQDKPKTRKYRCLLCGYIHDEAKDGPFDELERCPMCGSDPKNFVLVEEEGEDDGQADDSDKADKADQAPVLPEGEHARYKAEIRQMAESGKTIDAAMGPQPRPNDMGWEDILIKGGQLARRPLLETEEVKIETVIGKKAAKPMKLAGPVYVSHMSFGALSKEAKTALAMGSAMAGTATCSGEGGILEEEISAAHKYIFEYVPNKYSVTDENLKRADAIEIKIGQGTKPGMGGHLPGEKVTDEIAKIRGKEVGEDIISPANYEEIKTPQDLKKLVDDLRERSEGRPIGVKIAAGHLEEDLAFILEGGPDFITIDGRGGATGSSPMILRDSTSIPTIYALARARKYLDSVNSDVDLVITGGLRVSTDFAKALAMGADAVAVATAAMIAVGCRQFRICNSGRCPVGVATQDENLRKQINLDESAQKVGNYFKVCFEELKGIARITGKKDIAELDLTDIMTVSKEISDYTDIVHC